jgi:hypothetical protein
MLESLAMGLKELPRLRIEPSRSGLGEVAGPAAAEVEETGVFSLTSSAKTTFFELLALLVLSAL